MPLSSDSVTPQLTHKLVMAILSTTAAISMAVMAFFLVRMVDSLDRITDKVNAMERRVDNNELRIILNEGNIKNLTDEQRNIKRLIQK